MSVKPKLNVWLTQATEPLPMICKLRTSLYADKLIERGHDVTWFTSAFDHFSKKWLFEKDTDFELENGVKIKALKGIGYKKNISLARYIDHRVIAWKFKKMATKMEKPDIIIASMPSYDLAYESVIFARNNNIPVIVDIRDPWPDMFLNHVPKAFSSFLKILLYKDFQMIKKTMQMADSLIGVTSTFLEWGLNYAKREKVWKDRVFYLGYKKDVNFTANSDKISKLVGRLKHKFLVTFAGTFVSYHNPSILLDCAERLVSNDNIYFILAGDGELFNEVKSRANTMTNVILLGWLTQDEIITLLQYSHVGVCPTVKFIDLFPNKVFRYLSAGLPVISAFQGDLKEVIEKYQIGFYYPPNDVDTLVNCIKKLYDDGELYKQMAENAQRVFNNMFDADKIYEEYVELIEKVAWEHK